MIDRGNTGFPKENPCPKQTVQPHPTRQRVSSVKFPPRQMSYDWMLETRGYIAFHAFMTLNSAVECGNKRSDERKLRALNNRARYKVYPRGRLTRAMLRILGAKTLRRDKSLQDSSVTARWYERVCQYFQPGETHTKRP